MNLSQRLAYLFGEDELFTGEPGDISEQTKGRIIAYLGVMLGAGGAASLLLATSKKAAAVLGKKVAARALTKTAWYPLLKKVAAWIGVKLTKQSVGKAVTKAVPVLGGFLSAGITYITFKPMGVRLATELKKNLDGDFDLDTVLKEVQLAEEEPVSTIEVEEVFVSSEEDEADNPLSEESETTQQNNTMNGIELIKQLAMLHEQGILTDEEFLTKKADILAKL